eukprot:TRINITY_DN8950_c0_g1_i1.p1 TRINITY_DN8950_c0_g1~~TRINITY_DN8950_c0_g1_i1.p1  ORF type:complete len:198 (+),score=37.25 TRINITY_DN8950_c0_g1_i1:57-596(+)
MSSLESGDVATLFQFTGAALSIGLSTLGTALATGSLGSQIIDSSSDDKSSTYEILPGSNTRTSPAYGSMKKMVVVVMAGFLAIYGLIMAILITQSNDISIAAGVAKFSAGLAVGGACLASGYGMSRLKLSPNQTAHTATVLIMIFLESLGIYGLIIGLILNSNADIEDFVRGQDTPISP